MTILSSCKPSRFVVCGNIVGRKGIVKFHYQFYGIVSQVIRGNLLYGLFPRSKLKKNKNRFVVRELRRECKVNIYLHVKTKANL